VVALAEPTDGDLSMNRCLIARAVGAAAGGLLGSALLPMAAAFADDYAVVPDPSSVEEVSGIYGSGFFSVPQLPGAVDGSQLFDIDDTTVGTSTSPDVVGTFDADEATVAGGFGNEELLVTSDVSGNVGTAAGDVPPVGSVIDTQSLGPLGYEPYTALASPTPGADVTEFSREAAISDCQPSYRWLLDYSPEGEKCADFIAIAGDSAGGNLALVLSHWVRDSNLRKPDAVVALSPMTEPSRVSCTLGVL
jgi:hypothetical protein